jgi:hypothetical protein
MTFAITAHQQPVSASWCSPPAPAAAPAGLAAPAAAPAPAAPAMVERWQSFCPLAAAWAGGTVTVASMVTHHWQRGPAVRRVKQEPRACTAPTVSLPGPG